MVIYYIHLYKQNIGWSYYATYTYNTNRISDGSYYTTYTYNTNRISDGHIILHTLITQTEYLMVILHYIHL